MTRLVRVAIPGMPHHIAQRGNHQQRRRSPATTMMQPVMFPEFGLKQELAMRHSVFLGLRWADDLWQGTGNRRCFRWLVTSLIGMSVLSCPLSLQADEPSQANAPGAQKKVNDRMFDAKRTVESPVNHNSPPTIIRGGNARAVFPEDYDWCEQRRVSEVIESLMEHAEEAWPELVNALSDDRYSVTFNIHDSPSNWRIGHVCAEIIYDYLAQGYFSHSVPDTVDGRRWRAIMMRPAARDDLTKWCQERKNKRLYELQIETCEWAIAEIPESFPMASADWQQKAIAEIRAEIRSLKTAKKALRPDYFYMRKAMGEGGGAIGSR